MMSRDVLVTYRVRRATKMTDGYVFFFRVISFRSGSIMIFLVLINISVLYLDPDRTDSIWVTNRTILIEHISYPDSIDREYFLSG
jgi:hypothetical protein